MSARFMQPAGFREKVKIGELGGRERPGLSRQRETEDGDKKKRHFPREVAFLAKPFPPFQSREASPFPEIPYRPETIA
jgi:hypothetical protein